MFEYSLDLVSKEKFRGWAKSSFNEKVSYALLDENRVIKQGYIDSFRPDLAIHFSDDGCYSLDVIVSSELVDPRILIYDDEDMLEVNLSENITYSVRLLPWLEVIRYCSKHSKFLVVDNCLSLSFLIFSKTGVFPKTISKSELTAVESFDNLTIIWRFDIFSPYSVDKEIPVFNLISATCKDFFVELPSFSPYDFDPKFNVISSTIGRSDFFRVPTAEKLLNYFSGHLAARFIHYSHRHKSISFNIYKLNVMIPLVIFVSGASRVGKTNFSRAILGVDSNTQLLSLDLTVSSYLDSSFYLNNKSYDKIRAEFSLPKFYSILLSDEFLMVDFVSFVVNQIGSNSKKIVIEGVPVNKEFCELFKRCYGYNKAMYWLCESL